MTEGCEDRGYLFNNAPSEKMDGNTTVARTILYTLMGHMSIGSCNLISNYRPEVSVQTFQKKGLTTERPTFGLVQVYSPAMTVFLCCFDMFIPGISHTSVNCSLLRYSS